MEMNAKRPEWANRKTGHLAVPDRTVLKLSMANIYGNGADCVAWAVFGRRLSGSELEMLKKKLAYYKQELIHGVHVNTFDWDELDAVEQAVEAFARESGGIPYSLSTDLVQDEIVF